MDGERRDIEGPLDGMVNFHFSAIYSNSRKGMQSNSARPSQLSLREALLSKAGIDGEVISMKGAQGSSCELIVSAYWLQEIGGKLKG
jgi:hypothetical protein